MEADGQRLLGARFYESDRAKVLLYDRAASADHTCQRGCRVSADPSAVAQIIEAGGARVRVADGRRALVAYIGES